VDQTGGQLLLVIMGGILSLAGVWVTGYMQHKEQEIRLRG
jgi:hypothetical protein